MNRTKMTITKQKSEKYANFHWIGLLFNSFFLKL